MQSLQYLPYNRLGLTPNIIVDSVPIESTIITLSHWPASGSPPELKADLSAEIVFNFLEWAEAESIKGKAEAVSNNHFDEDGLVGIFALLNPEAAQVTFVLQAWAQPDKSPLNRTVFRRPYDEITGILYEELLPRFSNIFQRVHFLEQYWKEEDELLDWSENAIQAGSIKIDEYPHLDFSVIETPGTKEWVDSRPIVDGARWTHSVCHQFAAHNATTSSRILVTDGKRHDFYYRYETWVETVERKPPPRLDLKPIAERLNRLEGRSLWSAEHIKDIVPHLSMAERGQTKLSSASVKDAFIEFFSATDG